MSSLASTVASGGVERTGKRRFYLFAALALFALFFALGVMSWVGFFLAPEVAGGDPVRLFSQSDYVAVAIGADMVAGGRGADLYDFGAQRQAQQQLIRDGYLAQPLGAPLRYPYPYTPFIAVLMSPLSAISPLYGMAVWNLLNLAGMLVGMGLLLLSLPLSRQARLLLLLGGLTCLPFIANLEQGQSSGLTMLGMAGGIALLRRGKDMPAGLVLGVLLLKMQWLPLFALALLFKGRWRALLGVGVTGALLLLATILTSGVGWIPGFLAVAQRAQNLDPELILNPWYSHSITGQFAALLGGETVAVATNEVVKNLTYVAIVAVLAILVLVWRGPWRPGHARWDGAMALTVLGALFTGMQVNTHDLCLLAVPVSLGVAYFCADPLHSRRQSAIPPLWVWCSAGIALYLLTSSLLLSTSFNLPVRLITLLIAIMFAFLAARLMRSKLSPLGSGSL